MTNHRYCGKHVFLFSREQEQSQVKNEINKKIERRKIRRRKIQEDKKNDEELKGMISLEWN